MQPLLEAILGLNLASVTHLVHSGPRHFLRAGKRAFAAASSLETRELNKIPAIDLENILGERRPVIRLSVTRYEDGMLPSHQAMVLLAILVAERPKEVLEIGTYMGHTTRQMAENLETATIQTVDLPENFAESGAKQNLPKDDFHLIEHRVVGREFKDHSCAGRITQHSADTATFDFHQAGNPTFFFIDGSHTYEYCKHDSEECFDLCHGRGVFLWHDCDDLHPGVTKFILEWRQLGRDIKRIAGTSLAYWKSA
jgi:predicted O-methyltransferase YrrM